MMFFPLKSIANKTLTKPLGKDGTQKLYTVVTIDSGSPAAIFFTSGTSGESKAVLLSHSGIVSVINSYLEIFKVPDTALSVLPYHHAFGLICGAIIVFSSANTVFINTDLKYFLSDIKDSSANVMAVVPAHLEFIQKRIENSIKLSNSIKKFRAGCQICKFFSKLGINLYHIVFRAIYSQFGNDLQTFITGGAPISDTTLQFFRDIGLNVFNGYGLTETSPVVAVENFGSTRTHSCGKP